MEKANTVFGMLEQIIDKLDEREDKQDLHRQILVNKIHNTILKQTACTSYPRKNIGK